MSRSIKKVSSSGGSYKGQMKRKHYRTMKKTYTQQFRTKNVDILRKLSTDLDNDICFVPQKNIDWKGNRLMTPQEVKQNNMLRTDILEYTESYKKCLRK